MPRTGIEPVRLAARDFKSRTSTNFVIGAQSDRLGRHDAISAADYNDVASAKLKFNDAI